MPSGLSLTLWSSGKARRCIYFYAVESKIGCNTCAITNINIALLDALVIRIFYIKVESRAQTLTLRQRPVVSENDDFSVFDH